MDVLDGLDVIRICIGYQDEKGNRIDAFPVDAADYDGIEPIYEEIAGWKDSTFGAKCMEDLPANAVAYVKKLEEAVGAPIDIISTGPDRNETMILRNPFNGE